MIFTFYSFKGGVGRSMAMANVAWELARRGLRVLVIDFDLEAPGLERYFPVPVAAVHRNEGVIDLIESFKRSLTDNRGMTEAGFRQVEKFIYHGVADFGPHARLDLMPAGRRATDDDKRSYALAVRTFDWQDFYFNWEGQAFFEWLRRRLAAGDDAPYDVVLADSRTGVTEMGGVCACQLADVVVMLSAPNHQNVEGTRELAADLRSEPVQRLRQGRPPLEIVVVPARVEQRVDRLLKEFELRFTAAFDAYRPRAHVELGLHAIDLALPYVPEYAFEEQVTRQHERGPTELDACYGRLADALMVLCAESASPLLRKAASEARARLLPQPSGLPAAVEAAPAFDPSKRWAGVDAYLSCANETRPLVTRLLEELREQVGELRIAFGESDSFGSDRDLPPTVQEELRHAQALVLFADERGVRPWQRAEVALARALPRPPAVVRVLLPGAAPDAFDLVFGKSLADLPLLDLRRWPEDSGAMPLLARALADGAGREREEESPSPDTAAVVPFPGAACYTEADAPFFGGRDAEVQGLVEAVTTRSRVELHGASGVGKSSLVLAGLFPALRSHKRFTQLVYVDLERGVPEAGDLFQGAPELPASTLLVFDHADACDASLAAFVRKWWDAPDGPHVLLAWRGAPLAQAQAQALKLWEGEGARPARSAAHPLHHEAGAGDIGAMLQATSHARIELAPLQPGVLRTAVESALGKAGRKAEGGLVERVFSDALPHPAAASVQRALLHLWRHQARGFLTNDAYNAAGGVQGLLGEALARCLADGPPLTVAALLQRLYTPAPDESVTPRPMRWARAGTQLALQDAGAGFVARLARQGLVVIRREGADILVEPVARPPAWASLQPWMRPVQGVRAELEGVERAYAGWAAGDEEAARINLARGVTEAARPYLSRGELAFAQRRQAQQRERRLALVAAVVLGIAVFGYTSKRARDAELADSMAAEAQRAAADSERVARQLAVTQKAIDEARKQDQLATLLPVSMPLNPPVERQRVRLAVYASGTGEAEAAAVLALLQRLPAGEYEVPAAPLPAPAKTCGEVSFFHTEDAAAARRLLEALNGIRNAAKDPRLLDLSDRSLTSGAGEVPRGTVRVALPPQAAGPAQRQDRWGESRLVPAGCAVVGSDKKGRDELLRVLPTDRDLTWYATELPVRREWIDAFYIGRTEVTAGAFAQYQRACEQASPDCPRWSPRFLDPQKEPLRPATFVSWTQARDYCRWAGGRLPTDLEWEKAARGTDGRFWPWGFQADDRRFQGVNRMPRAPVAVGSFPQGNSPYEVADMSGNVWEYTADLWSPTSHTIRGGSFLNTLMESRGSVRWASSLEDKGADYLGFRCVAEARP